jgi:hypothetical protein
MPEAGLEPAEEAQLKKLTNPFERWFAILGSEGFECISLRDEKIEELSLITGTTPNYFATLKVVHGYEFMSRRRGFCQSNSGCSLKWVVALKSMPQA